jgi:hypothetical protein
VRKAPSAQQSAEASLNYYPYAAFSTAPTLFELININ